MIRANDSKRRGRRCGLFLLLGLVTVAAGCGKSTPPQFHLNMQGRDPADFQLVGGEKAEDRKTKEVRIKGRQDIVNVLYAMFGTPDKPYVFPESGLDLAKIKLAAGPAGGNADGTQRGLYRQHCVHCHGISGDGAGPTAAFLYPYPRDYRKGIYKFKATERSARPRAVDLENVLRQGIPGTAMPSFILLPSDEIEALAEYVRYLSIRGEVETFLGLTVFGDEEPLEMDRASLVDNYLKPVAESWAQAVDQVIVIKDRPPVDTSEQLAASIKAGRELFRGGKAQCMKCHGPTALGDGSEERLFDDWNKDKKFAESEKKFIEMDKAISDAESAEVRESLQREKARMKRQLASWQLPEMEIQPRNLRTGIYRGGRAPADLYRRIYAGVNGTPMPATGANPTTLKPEEIWQIVDYVRSLPYEALSMPIEGETTIHKPQL